MLGFMVYLRGSMRASESVLRRVPVTHAEPNTPTHPTLLFYHLCSNARLVSSTPSSHLQKLLDTMWQDPTGARPNKFTYDLVIQACGHGGEWELGVALIDDMRDLSIAPDAQTFNIAVAACARSGERLAAETLVANMWKACVAPDEFTYASLVAA